METHRQNAEDHPQVKESNPRRKSSYVGSVAVLPGGLGYSLGAVKLQSFEVKLAGVRAPTNVHPKGKVPLAGGSVRMVPRGWSRSKAAMASGNLLSPSSR